MTIKTTDVAGTEHAVIYDAVYPRDPVEWSDESGDTHTFTPPFMFGVMG